MKNAMLIILVILHSHVTTGQVWNWATSIGSAGDEYGGDIAIDAADNIYILGDFSTSSITIDNTTLTNTQTPYGDIFLVKYNAQGNFLWAKSFGGTGNDFSTDIDVDNSGNILITGGFDSPYFYVGSDSITGLGMWDFYDTFVIKLDSSGNLIWGKCDLIFSDDAGFAITSDAAGNVYTTGNSGTSAVVKKYDSAGNSPWTITFGGSLMDVGASIKADAAGNVYVAGIFTSPSITFGSTTYYNMSPVPSLYLNDVFVLKLNASGNIIWSQVAGGVNDERATLTIDPSGNVFLAGTFTSPFVVFGSDTLQNAGGTDAFISKYDNSGNLLWLNSIGSPGSEGISDIETDALGDIHLTGSFNSSLTFGSSTITSAGSGDIFIARYNTMGVDISAVSAGNTGNESGTDIEFISGGSMIIGGGFNSSSITLGTNTILNAGNRDLFLAMMDQVVNTHELIQSEIKVYPNPAKDKVYLQLNSNTEEIKLKIYDIHGRAVYENNYLHENNISVDMNLWQAGMYLIKIENTGDDYNVMKVVKW